MAVLSLDTLTGCSSIPSFLGGTSDTPANPSITLFHNSTAPTNWTKNTSASINDIALRVRGGAEGVGISTGGTLPFTTVLAQKTTPITSSPSPVGSATGPSPVGDGFTNQSSASPADAASLTEAQIPSHAHTISKHPGQAAPATTAPGAAGAASAAQSLQTTEPGGSAQGTHTHPGYSTPAQHAHPLTDGSGHNHQLVFSGPGGHTHSFTPTQDFRVFYVDIIIATKD